MTLLFFQRVKNVSKFSSLAHELWNKHSLYRSPNAFLCSFWASQGQSSWNATVVNDPLLTYLVISQFRLNICVADSNSNNQIVFFWERRRDIILKISNMCFLDNVQLLACRIIIVKKNILKIRLFLRIFLRTKWNLHLLYLEIKFTELTKITFQQIPT